MRNSSSPKKLRLRERDNLPRARWEATKGRYPPSHPDEFRRSSLEIELRCLPVLSRSAFGSTLASSKLKACIVLLR